MRPAKAPLFDTARKAKDIAALRTDVAALRPVASASFQPKGANYDPRRRLRRPVVALRGGKNAAVLAFSASGGTVRVRVLTNGELSSDDIERSIAAARGIAAVDDDPTEFFAMVKGHAILGPLARRGDPRLAATPTVFESLAAAIIEQLVTGLEARASIRRLWQIAGDEVTGTSVIATPTAAAVHRVPMWRMHEIGVGSRRAVTLHRAAGRGEAIERLRDVAPQVAIDKLESLPGVGPWTSNAVARNAFAWSDAVPVGDFHAPFVIPAALGSGAELRRDDPAAADRAMLEVLEPFRPHRARVALLLEQLPPEPGARPRRLPRVDPHRREPWRY